MNRYSRNIALTQIGKDGQDALLEAKVLVIGAGGLGSPVILYLAAAGVGTIGIADSDRLELSNLQRQIIYTENSIGKKKVDEASAAVASLNSDIKIIKHQLRFEPHAADIITNYDIIADCSDNFSTRFLLNEACFAHKKTLVSAAVTGFSGQVATFKSYLGENYPCYRCFCPEIPPEDLLPNCISGGVLGSVAGVIGSMQATEIIKEILRIGESLSGNILFYDGLKGSVRKTGLKKNKNCKTCR